MGLVLHSYVYVYVYDRREIEKKIGYDDMHCRLLCGIGDKGPCAHCGNNLVSNYPRGV